LKQFKRAFSLPPHLSHKEAHNAQNSFLCFFAARVIQSRRSND